MTINDSLRRELRPFPTLSISYSLQGKRHIVADALSRSPYFAAPENSNDFNENSLIADNPHFCRWTTQNPSFRRLVDIAREDVEYQRIVDCIKNGINVRTLGKDHPAKCLQAVWDRLTLQEVAENPLIILDHSRIYVPIAGRIHLLYNLHEGHPGQTKMQLFTAKFYYWPKLSKDVINFVENCELCQKYASSRKREPFQQYEPEYAQYPMQSTGLDVFQYKNNHFLIMVDRFSGYIFVKKLTNLTSQHTCEVLQRWYTQFGWPEYQRSDAGSTFAAEYQDWCVKNDITPQISSAFRFGRKCLWMPEGKPGRHRRGASVVDRSL